MGTAGKKPPAPSVSRRQNINARTAGDIYAGLERLGADDEPLAIVGSR
jgi:hypothetical protein